MRAFLSPKELARDVRSAIIASITAFVITLGTNWLFAKSPVEFIQDVNAEGIGKPEALFQLAEEEDPKLKLQFNPPELRHVYVCEFKRLAGESYRKILLQYFDSYRECFDVAVRGENEYVIFPNKRTSRLEQRKSTFLCACSGLANR